MKLWVDTKPAPEGMYWVARSVNEAKSFIEQFEIGTFPFGKFELIDIGYNAGDCASEGGHYIKLLEWLEETGRNYPIHIHGDNQINLLWMREIIDRNGWKEV